MGDKEKLMQLFAELTVFATPEKAAKHFQENHVVIQKYGHWKPTGMHLLPYQCSACESKEEGRTNYCPNCGARMKGGNEDG
jgi:tRNA(Ile2) C34 agmatinyltransferase TiaS